MKLPELLFPRHEDKEPRFREEVRRLSLGGLRVIAGICAGVPLFMYAVGALLLPSLPAMGIVMGDLTLVLLGAVLLALSFWRPAARRARLLGILLGLATAVLQSAGMMLSREFHTEVLHTVPQQHFPMTLTIVLLVGMAALPVTPAQTFLLGGSIVAFFVALIVASEGAEGLSGWMGFPVILSSVIVLLSTGLTAILRSEASSGEIWIEVRDEGRGIEPERIPTLFEPALRVEGGRVATTNWGLFVSRSIAAEHGGDLQIDSVLGRGTTARLSLPLPHGGSP